MGDKLLFTVPAEYDNMLAQHFLKKHCGLSSRLITRLKQIENGITMNGKLLRSVDFVKAGAVVEIKIPEENSGIQPIEGSLDICFEDDCFLIVNKPPLMPVHPVKQHQNDTLANIVAYYCQCKNEDYTFRAINRLDRDTSGLVIIAKNRFCANAMKGIVNKTYYAICHGKTEPSGTINKPIGLLEDSKMVRHILEDGPKAVTHFKTLKSDNNISFIELWLETGRTHQIRCHMSSIGHPLLGDDLYGGSLELISRQTLHCGKVSFIHPVTNKEITVNASLPEDMADILKALD
ncbi:MAG: RluA family pseudouridine synthase [Ruminococcus sp.]|nr:RluA family pseudouridine synthase [Ruminococcus sp.]